MWLFGSKRRNRARGENEGVYFELGHSFLGSELIEEVEPPLADAELERLGAEQAAELLHSGQSLVAKRVEGDLILGSPDLSFLFEAKLPDGRKAILAGIPSAPRVVRKPFNHPLKIKGCIFEGRIGFAGLWFKGDIQISGTRFCREVDLQHSTFDQGIVFRGCWFGLRAQFSDTTCFGEAYFNESVFADLADFYNTEFSKGASFTKAHFSGGVNFGMARFLSPIAFIPCLDLTGIVCEGPGFFPGTKFDGLVDFRDSRFRGRTEFSEAEFCYVRFTRAEFAWLGLAWEQIKGERLLFGTVRLYESEPPKTIANDELNALFRQRMDAPLPEKHRQYDILKAVFQRQGDYVSADGCFYEWKQIERRHSPLGWQPQNWVTKAFHYMNWLSCGYGVMPMRTLLFASFSIILFALAYLVVDLTAGLMFESKQPALSYSLRLGATFLSNLEFSFLAFMNFTAADVTVSPLAHALFVVERLLGWFTLLLFVTTYTRIMLR